MGCVHMYVERKVNGVWQHCNPPTYELAHDFDWYVRYEEKEEDRSENADRWKIERDYRLFSILSGVRKKIEDHLPIKPCPHEIPKDTCQAIRGKDDGSCHSHSWYTFSELIEFDWRKKIGYGDENLEFLESFIPELLKLGEPDDVRCVFWYDS